MNVKVKITSKKNSYDAMVPVEKVALAITAPIYDTAKVGNIASIPPTTCYTVFDWIEKKYGEKPDVSAVWACKMVEKNNTDMIWTNGIVIRK